MYQSFAKLHLNQLITTTECISRNNCDGRIDDLVVAEFPICPALCRENVGLYCHRSKHVIKNNPPASHTPPRIGAITIDDIQKQEWLESTETRSSGLPKNVKECQPSVRRHLRFTSLPENAGLFSGHLSGRDDVKHLALGLTGKNCASAFRRNDNNRFLRL